MPTYTRYAEDPTGVNPNNLVSGELHSLSNRAVRAVVPKYAPFFSASLAVYDNLTQRLLVKGTDYKVPVILREATLRYGMEVADALLIENTAVSSQVRVTYQAVGGDLQNNIDNIVNIYEAMINDNRNVDWVSSVLGKPSEYPPSEHNHYLSEIFGFEPLAFELERMTQAILLGNSPAFDAIIQAMKDQVVTHDEIDTGVGDGKYVTLDKLIYALDKFNFNTMTMTPNEATLYNGENLWIALTATNIADRVTYYWTVEHVDTTSADFVSNSGVVNMLNGKGSFMLQLVRTELKEENETFRIAIRKNGPDGHILATSRLMTLAAHTTYSETRILEAVRIESMNSPRMKLTAKTHAAHQGAWNATFN